MKAALIVVLSLVSPGFGANKTPAVSKEARRHFIRAVTFQKEAKAPADYERAIDEYRKALELAPNWLEARYNLSVALESAKHFDEAIEELRRYIDGKPKDVRKAEDRLMALEAKAELASEKASTESQAARAAREQEEFLRGIDGARYSAPYRGLRGEAVITGNEIKFYVHDPEMGRLGGTAYPIKGRGFSNQEDTSFCRSAFRVSRCERVGTISETEVTEDFYSDGRKLPPMTADAIQVYTRDR